MPKFHCLLLGHDWNAATCITPETCNTCGITRDESIGHVWQDATCEGPKTCSVCGKTKGKPLGHVWQDATCEKPRTCSVCGKTDGEPLGHIWIEGTCTNDEYCFVCGKIGKKATGHQLNSKGICSSCGENVGIDAYTVFDNYMQVEIELNGPLQADRSTHIGASQGFMIVVSPQGDLSTTGKFVDTTVHYVASIKGTNVFGENVHEGGHCFKCSRLW